MSSRRGRLPDKDLSTQRLQDKRWQATYKARQKKGSSWTNYSHQSKSIEINLSLHRDNLGIVLSLPQEDVLLSIVAQSLMSEERCISLLLERRLMVIQEEKPSIQDVTIACEAIRSSSRSILVIVDDLRRCTPDIIASIRAFVEENQSGLILL